MQKQLLGAVDKVLKFLDETQLGRIIRAKRYQRKMSDLEDEIAGLEAQVRAKKAERDALGKKISKVLKGAVRGIRKYREGPTLEAAIVATLQKVAKPIGLTELSKALLDSGYRTGSAFANFRTTVAHKLKAMRAMLSKSAEGYSVKAAKKTRAVKLKRKARASASPKEEALTGAAANA